MDEEMDWTVSWQTRRDKGQGAAEGQQHLMSRLQIPQKYIMLPSAQQHCDVRLFKRSSAGQRVERFLRDVWKFPAQTSLLWLMAGLKSSVIFTELTWDANQSLKLDSSGTIIKVWTCICCKGQMLTQLKVTCRYQIWQIKLLVLWSM